jgi:hydrogenase maturation protease
MTAAGVLVLGLGNDLLGDDAVGLHVARDVRSRLAGAAGCAVRETMEMGLALLDEIVGCEHLILVDAIETGKAPPGHIHEFDADALAGRRIAAPHFVGVVETLALGRTLGLTMPRDVRIFAIEVKRLAHPRGPAGRRPCRRAHYRARPRPCPSRRVNTQARRAFRSFAALRTPPRGSARSPRRLGGRP